MARESQGGRRVDSESARPLEHPLAAWIVLTVCCVATFISYSVSRSQMVDREFELFQRRTDLIAKEIEKRLLDYEHGLAAARAFLLIEYPVKRGAWRTFVERLNIQRFYPNAGGIGFVERVSHDRLAAFLMPARTGA